MAHDMMLNKEPTAKAAASLIYCDDSQVENISRIRKDLMDNTLRSIRGHKTIWITVQSRAEFLGPGLGQRKGQTLEVRKNAENKVVHV